MSLVNELIKELIDDKQVTAVYGGGFKPPIQGHFYVVKKALEEFPEIDKFIIYVGGGVRDGISQDESLLVWNIYKKYLGDKIEIIPSKSPIGDVLRYGKNNPDEVVYFVIGGREGREDDVVDIASRTKGVKEKYPNMEVKVLTTTDPEMSGTNARKALKVSEEEFIKYLPPQLTDEEKIEVYNLVSPVVKEGDTYEKMAANGKKAGSLKQGTVRKRLGIPKDKKIPLSLINKEIARLKKMDKDPDKKGAQLGDKNQKYYKALQLAKTLKTTTNVNENASYSKDIDIKGRIMQLTQYMLDKGYNIEPLPAVEFVDGDSENAREFLGKTAYYNPEKQTIVLYTEGRHPKDIVRSFAHEMIHHIQNLEGRLGSITTTNTQEDDYLNDIEAEANLQGTMTFRNWTDSLNEAILGDKIECDGCGWSWKIVDGGDDLFICHKCGYDNSPLNEDGQEISDKNMDDYKKDNNPKGVKDPFGLNAFAQELARGLEEELEEGRKKKKDPKKGTGKKPKGSGRRLYTDEDPKDTVGIKFRTKEDIVDTLNKKSFKAKSHARQSQIINLIHQRVRAAYGKAKDPETKARLKRGLDYITKRKEASKKKTQRLKKLKEQQLNKFGGDATPESTPKMSFEDRLAYYTDYYINVSPSTFDIITEDGTIVIGGLDKPYPANFNDTKDTRQVPVNENVPDAKDDGKAAPYGSGYEKLDEGRYDTLANKLSSIAFEAFKDIHDRGDKEGEFEFRVDNPEDEHDIPSEEFYFDFVGKVEITDDEYEVDGGANAGFDKDGNEITPLLSVKFRIPKNPDWQRVSFDIKDVVRHELEHLTQDGDNVKPSKQMDDDQMLRDLIDLDLLPKADYFRLEKEVDAMLQGLYFKAKKSKRPFKDVVNTYLDIFTSQETITQEEKENILDIWRSRAKALSLPVFESKYKLGKVLKEEEVEQQYTIYCDMDGVLTNFDKQFKELSGGIAPKDYEDKYGKDAFWSLISEGGVGYWVGMPWMPNGKQLWEYISKYNPIILSAPSRENESRLGKRLWVRNNLKPKPKLILASAANKPNYSTRNKILIDDRPDTIDNWNAKGGTGILFKSTSQVIEELKKLGL